MTTVVVMMMMMMMMMMEEDNEGFSQHWLKHDFIIAFKHNYRSIIIIIIVIIIIVIIIIIIVIIIIIINQSGHFAADWNQSSIETESFNRSIVLPRDPSSTIDQIISVRNVRHSSHFLTDVPQLPPIYLPTGQANSIT